MDTLDRSSVSAVQRADMRASVRKRTYNLDGEMIERVRRLYDAKIDTEAIHKALRKVIDDREIEEALDRLLRAGRFRTVYR
jgi:Arc/MetJ family transcription regulator